MIERNKAALSETVSWILVGLALLAVLLKGLVAALLSGMLVYSLVQLAVRLLEKKIRRERARTVAVALLGAVTVLLISMAQRGPISFLLGEAGNLHGMVQQQPGPVQPEHDQE